MLEVWEKAVLLLSNLGSGIAILVSLFSGTAVSGFFIGSPWLDLGMAMVMVSMIAIVQVSASAYSQLRLWGSFGQYNGWLIAFILLGAVWTAAFMGWHNMTSFSFDGDGLVYVVTGAVLIIALNRE